MIRNRFCELHAHGRTRIGPGVATPDFPGGGGYPTPAAWRNSYPPPPAPRNISWGGGRFFKHIMHQLNMHNPRGNLPWSIFPMRAKAGGPEVRVLSYQDIIPQEKNRGDVIFKTCSFPEGKGDIPTVLPVSKAAFLGGSWCVAICSPPPGSISAKWCVDCICSISSLPL
jgi:hypothetical protein